MAYTFLKGSTLIVEFSGVKYELMISSFEGEQTFKEASQKVQTLHNKELLSREFVEREANSSFSFSFDMTRDGIADGFVFDWFGFPKSVNQSYSLTTTLTADKYKTAKLYLRDAIGTTTTIDGAVLETIDMTFRRNNIFSLKLSGTGGKLLFDQPTVTHDVTQQDRPLLGGNPVIATLDNVSIPHVSTVSLSLSKGVNWVDNKSLFDDTSYTSSTFYIEKLTMAGTVESYKSGTEAKSSYSKQLKLQTGGFMVTLPVTNVTERIGVASVFMKFLDFNANPSASIGIISYQRIT